MGVVVTTGPRTADGGVEGTKAGIVMMGVTEAEAAGSVGAAMEDDGAEDFGLAVSFFCLGLRPRTATTFGSTVFFFYIKSISPSFQWGDDVSYLPIGCLFLCQRWNLRKVFGFRLHPDSTRPLSQSRDW